MGGKKKGSVAFREPLVSLGALETGSDQSMARVTSDVMEETSHGQYSMQKEDVPESSLLLTQTKSDQFVSIDIPSNLSNTHRKENSLGATSGVYAGSSSNVKSSSRGLPPKPKAKIPSGTLNMEEVAILALGGLQPPPSETEKSPFLSKPLTRLVAPIDRAASMPSSSVQLQPSNSKSTSDYYVALNTNGVGEQQPIYRSRSVPVNYTDGDNHVRVLRVVPKRIMTERSSIGSSSASSIHNDEEDQEDITEEEAVCRICFEEIGEDLETFKLECNCKGDLALVHRHCSQKWFNIKGNKTCEICREEVRNITVKVRRMPAIDLSSLQQPPMMYADRLWHEFPILVVGSIVGYFISTTMLRKSRGGIGHIDVSYSIIFSCIMGLIASFAASAFAHRKHVWIYSLVQLLIFTVLAQFFYVLLRLKPLPALVISAFLALVICGIARPVFRVIKKWRGARRNQLTNNAQDGAPPMGLQLTTEAAERHRSDTNHHES